MDFMKVLDQTVREIKREVNLKVLKVPEIEQKVLDATSDEPWGPHGSALSEIAQATKNFTECQLIMNALWTRLTDTGPNWRHVYKALTVIEYLIANGSERAVDNILEHSFKIASISGFEYVEPNGKDSGINVRKKVETISALLKNKEKMQEVRNKAAANRDKYFGLSSTGITYKSNSTGSSSFYDTDRYGSRSGGIEGGSFRDSYREKERYGEDSDLDHGNKSVLHESGESLGKENGVNMSKKGVTRNHGSSASNNSKPLAKPSPAPSKSSNVQEESNDDDLDDFDPRGSSTAGSAGPSVNQVDLFGESLFSDFVDTPTSIATAKASLSSATHEVDLFANATFASASTHASTPIPISEKSISSSLRPEVDLFADAAFVSASPSTDAKAGSHAQGNVDLFTSKATSPDAFSTSVDLFAASNAPLSSKTTSPSPEPTIHSSFDPFAAIPLNNFEGSDLFGGFTANSDTVSAEPQQNSGNETRNMDQNASLASKPAPKKDTFQVKSGIWADSLSRGLIDLNITAPKKVSMADIGIVGGIADGYDEKEKGPTSAYMGRAMGAGTGLGRHGMSSMETGGNGSFPTLSEQQFGSFK